MKIRNKIKLKISFSTYFFDVHKLRIKLYPGSRKKFWGENFNKSNILSNHSIGP